MMHENRNGDNAIKQYWIGAAQFAVALIVGLPAINQTAFAQADKPKIIHDAEYYILEAQHGEVWAAQDKELDQKLAELRAKYGAPPNIIHIIWDDTAVGEVGIPAIQKLQGFETPNINRLAAEGINFMRMYSEPSCTPSRAACMTGRLPVRNGMYNVGFPYEYGGLAASEVTMADVLSKAGYATAFYGKWHLGDIETSYCTNHGFDEALWMPYNQAVSVFTPQGQMAALTPAVMFPKMFAKDPYDMDPGWRPIGYVFALEGTKGGPVREFGRAPSYEDYLKIEGECQKRTIAFTQKNAAAKKAFYIDYWPLMGSLLGFPNRVTASGGPAQEGLARLDVWIGSLMDELKRLGIAENTLVVLMADNGPFTHNGPPGMVETLYRGGKGDFLEGGVRVPAMAWWPGVIAPGQTVGDIIDVTDLFNIMKVRHQLWMAKYPNTPEARDFPLTGIENARPETKAAGQPRVDPSKLPFDPREFIKSVPGWDGAEFDQAGD